MPPHVLLHTRAGRRRASAAIAVVAGVLLAAIPAASRDSAEFQLKAAFLKTFPQFVTWPRAALEGRSTFDICVAPPDTLGPSLRELVKGTTVGGRPVVVRLVNDSAAGCQVLFVSALAPDATGRLRALAGMPVLTVTDAKPRGPGAVIQLRVVANKVRFDVNLAAANAAGLKLNAQLLRVALNVTGGAE